MKLSILISLFAQIANVSADPSTLMNDAKCIQACVPGIDMKLSILISLFAGGSSTTGGCVTGGTGAPVADPGSTFCIYIQTDSVPAGQMFLWYNGAWHG